MNFTFENYQNKWDEIFFGDTIDLSKVHFVDPWAMGLICLKAIEQIHSCKSPSIILPEKQDTLAYLKRMHFHKFLQNLGYEEKYFRNFKMQEVETGSVHEIMHCTYRDEFNARLSSKVRRMLKEFGLESSDEQKVTSLVGELGNNVFDHNEGAWPTETGGAVIIGQKYKESWFSKKTLQFVVADPGVGFLGSLKAHKSKPTNDLEALKLGLSGVTGRIGEKRGNGLKLIQKWTIQDFSGEVHIQSGKGLVIISREATKENVTKPILGTLAELVIRYR